jgi:hypothetical protein
MNDDGNRDEDLFGDIPQRRVNEFTRSIVELTVVLSAGLLGAGIVDGIVWVICWLTTKI